ncbi:transposase [Hyella patelloides LEGE 07179]|uniref:Transposase n=2 Tax=Hyella TaxID=945733 RepID=A0A563VR19_9CYAN|nr:transposase [Hyella patelloides LEGE 07179]
MGRSESTIHYWLQLYKTGGMAKLLEEPPQTGRPKKLEIETIASLQQEISEQEGFNSYKEIKLWLSICQNIEISYPTIHRIVRYELKGKLKIPRPIHEKQQPGVIEAFKNHFPDRIKGLISELRDKWGDKLSISYWFQDETRLGYRTESGRKITRAGVKPKQILQWHYSYYYIYGLVEPVGGRSFFYEFSHFNSNCLGAFLAQFVQEYSQEIHIIQLDNASVHTAHKLIVPENIILLFQPPYCPELNPIERVWQYIKQKLKNLFFASLDDVKYKVGKILNSLSEDIIYSLTGWEYILDALSL